MADKETSALTAGTDPKAALFHAVQGGNSRKFVGDVVAHQFRGAKARMTADDAAVNATGGVTLTFDEAPRDTDSFWSAGAPTRLTIPAGLGITDVVATCQISVSSTTANTHISFNLNQFSSADAAKEAWSFTAVEKGGTIYRGGISSGPVAVADGDYFTVSISEESDTSITIEGDQTNRCFLALHVVGMTPV